MCEICWENEVKNVEYQRCELCCTEYEKVWNIVQQDGQWGMTRLEIAKISYSSWVTYEIIISELGNDNIRTRCHTWDDKVWNWG